MALSRARKKEGILLADGVEVPAGAAEKLVKTGGASPEELSDKRHLSSILSDFLECWGRGTLDLPF